MVEPAEICILVCGARDYADMNRVYVVLDELDRERPVVMVIHGGSSGADRFASNWACERGVHQRDFPADWRAHGKAAGPIRNRRMLEEGEPDLVIAFPGGRGTADMVRQAKAAGVPVREVAGG